MIYYFAYPSPSTGGDFVNIEHVTTLARCGFAARMLYPGPRGQHAGLPRDAQPMSDTRLGPEDYFVIPENDTALIEHARGLPCKIVIHNQNTFYFLQAIGSLQALDAAKFDTVICPSRGSAAMLTEAGYLGSVSVVQPCLPDYFAPAPKRLCIAYAPGKLPVESAAVKTAFASMFPQHAAIEWHPIAKMSRRQVAQLLTSSAIYAAFSNLESLSLSTLEAMKSGCIVVGDHGGGGLDYATPENGLWLRANEIIGFSRQLAQAVDLFHRDGHTTALVAHAMHTAGAFSDQRFEQDLTDFWSARMKP